MTRKEKNPIFFGKKEEEVGKTQECFLNIEQGTRIYDLRSVVE